MQSTEVIHSDYHKQLLKANNFSGIIRDYLDPEFLMQPLSIFNRNIHSQNSTHSVAFKH